MVVENKYVSIKDYTNGNASVSNFEFRSKKLLLELEEGSEDIIVKVLYVSIDPYQLNRMKFYSASQSSSDFTVRLVPGEEIDAFGVGNVMVSGNPNYEKGDLVVGFFGWGEYAVVKKGGMINKITTAEFPLSYHLGVLGTSGLTAYSGFYEVCKPNKSDKVFVSAASGSVGNLVGQMAKLHGCYVVGCAGSQKKVDILKEKLGFDNAFNYKEEPDLKTALKKYFPDGIDVYFDNVGGEMLEAAVANMKINGRVAVCGVIAEYTDGGKKAAPDMLDVLYKRITIRGFFAFDYVEKYGDFLTWTQDALKHGKIQVLEDISDGLESIPLAFEGLFKGDNVGKKIVKIADP